MVFANAVTCCHRVWDVAALCQCQELIMFISIARGIVAGLIMTLMPRLPPIYNHNKD
jgi:hypothetical protein